MSKYVPVPTRYTEVLCQAGEGRPENRKVESPHRGLRSATATKAPNLNPGHEVDSGSGAVARSHLYRRGMVGKTRRNCPVADAGGSLPNGRGESTRRVKNARGPGN